MTQRWKVPLVALGGPLVLGAIVGMRGGVGPLVAGALFVPAVLLGVTLLMIPALYIGASLVGVAPSPAALGAAVARALYACGVLLLGLAAPAAFLLATTARVDLDATIGAVAIAAGALAALRVVCLTIVKPGQVTLRSLALCATWSMIGLAMGGRLYLAALGTWTR